MLDDELDVSKLEEEVAKITDEDKPSDSTADKTSEEKDESTRTDTSLKTEKDESELSEKKEEDADEPPFHTHPAWIKRNEKLKQLEQERDEALNQARTNQEIRERLGDMNSDEILRLKNAGELLRKYPELAQKVQKIIDEHPYGNEETTRKISEVEQRQIELEQKLLIRDYDNTVESLISKHKVDESLVPYVKKFLDYEVINNKTGLNDVPKVFEGVLKDIEKIRRQTLASHIEHKEKEPRVPESSTQKGKVVTTKKESAELEDIISEMTEGLKAGSAPFKEE